MMMSLFQSVVANIGFSFSLFSYLLPSQPYKVPPIVGITMRLRAQIPVRNEIPVYIGKIGVATLSLAPLAYRLLPVWRIITRLGAQILVRNDVNDGIANT